MSMTEHLRPLRDYRAEDRTLSVLPGRPRVREQELRRFGQLVRSR